MRATSRMKSTRANFNPMHHQDLCGLSDQQSIYHVFRPDNFNLFVFNDLLDATRTSHIFQNVDEITIMKIGKEEFQQCSPFHYSVN
jgi:hypothetical protein